MGVLKRAALLVALVAIFVGSIGKLKPELFLALPSGFILWAMTGNPMPPYISYDAWKEHGWLRDGDLVVSVGAKSGTTWMLYCTHQIRTRASDAVEFGDVSLSTPWPELIQRPGASWLDHIDELNSTILPSGKPLREFWDNPSFPFRIFKSHSGPKSHGGDLPVSDRPKVRYLAMARNGLDVVASLVPFFDQHADRFRRLWGGFPPASSGNVTKDAASRFDDVIPGGVLADMYWKYIRSWWAVRDAPNVLLLHYSDLKRDLKGAVSKLASFLQVDLTSEEVERVTERCSMPHMKAHPEYFVYELPLHPEFPGTIMHNGAMVRKGGLGDGKAVFSPEQVARWNQFEEEQFPDAAMREWAREGGPFA